MGCKRAGRRAFLTLLFAKPESGFNLQLTEKATRQIESIIDAHPKIRPQWDAICKRIVFTGHRDGTRLYILEDSNSYILAFNLHDMPNLQVVYTILGDTLTIRSIRAVSDD